MIEQVVSRSSIGSARAALLAALSLAGCGKSVPADLRPTLDAVRPDADKVATAAAAVCAAQYASGRFAVKGGGCSTNLLPGETLVPDIPSPAKGTPLESNPAVVDVKVNCMATTTPPGTNPAIGCGSGLGSLHGAREIAPPDRGIAESHCTTKEVDCVRVLVPSNCTTAPDSADLVITKPVSGGPPGAYAEVTVALTKK